MSQNEQDRYALTETEREAALSSLVSSATEGQVSLDEFFRWTDDVVAATSRAELVAVTSQVEMAPPPAITPRRSWWLPFGNRIQRGRFVLPERTRAFVGVGEIHLDLRGATLVGPTPTLKAWIFVGSVRVLVPSGMSVEVDQSSMLGGRRIVGHGPPPNPLHPLLKIRMIHFMGNVLVTDDPTKWSPVVAAPRVPASSWTPPPLPPEAMGTKSWPEPDHPASTDPTR